MEVQRKRGRPTKVATLIQQGERVEHSEATPIINVSEVTMKRSRGRPRKHNLPSHTEDDHHDKAEDGLDILNEKKGYMKMFKDSSGRTFRNYHTKTESYMNQLPWQIREYVVYTDDVDGDGNCGYHSLTEQLGIFEAAVRKGMTPAKFARKRMVATLEKRRSFYKELVGHGQEFDDMVARVLGPDKEMDFLPSQYWMIFPVCGHLIADTFNCVVHYFTPTGGTTFTPKWQKCEYSLKTRRVVLGYVNGNHIIIVKLKDNCPLPPICEMVKNKELDSEIWKGWMTLYEENHQLWEALTLSKKPLVDVAVEPKLLESDDE